MPLPGAPMKVSCQPCGWSKIIPIQGDVFFAPSHCERCGSDKLAREAAGILDIPNRIGNIFFINNWKYYV